MPQKRTANCITCKKETEHTVYSSCVKQFDCAVKHNHLHAREINNIMKQQNKGYKAFYKGKTIEVFAESSYQAQVKAAEQFKARKRYDVSVVLCQMADGTQVIHSTAID